MRLLQHNSSGQFSLTEDFVDDNIPEYAILSHPWGAAAEEVTFRDLMGDTEKSKAGYDKILFCGEQTRRDCLKYFFGWTRTTLCSHGLSNLCFAGAVMRLRPRGSGESRVGVE